MDGDPSILGEIDPDMPRTRMFMTIPVSGLDRAAFVEQLEGTDVFARAYEMSSGTWDVELASDENIDLDPQDGPDGLLVHLKIPSFVDADTALAAVGTYVAAVGGRAGQPRPTYDNDSWPPAFEELVSEFPTYFIYDDPADLAEAPRRDRPRLRGRLRHVTGTGRRRRGPPGSRKSPRNTPALRRIAERPRPPTVETSPRQKELR